VCEFPFEKKDIEKCESIMDMDNLLIAPTFGFVDA
jgi:predicted alpha/beta-fold hydrolase